jgi:hypothetical protein
MLTKSVTKRAATVIATVALATAAAATDARAAGIFSPSPDPFPNGSGFDLHAPSGICVTATECTYDIFISGLTWHNATAIAGGYEEELTATFVASFEDPVTHAPTGTGTLTLVPGTYFTADVTGGYNPFTNPTGTFPETLVSASFAGTDSNGNNITASLSATPTTGTVIISHVTDGFNIVNAFTVNAQSTVNGAPITVPSLDASSTSAPEPASLGLLAVSMIGTAFARRSRRVVQA